MNKIICGKMPYLLDKFIRLEVRLKALPQLTELEKVKFDNSNNIDHLYFSSKIEGINLTKKQIEQAIYGT